MIGQQWLIVLEHVCRYHMQSNGRNHAVEAIGKAWEVLHDQEVSLIDCLNQEKLYGLYIKKRTTIWALELP